MTPVIGDIPPPVGMPEGIAEVKSRGFRICLGEVKSKGSVLTIWLLQKLLKFT
jgi:hypothetical protein